MNLFGEEHLGFLRCALGGVEADEEFLAFGVENHEEVFGRCMVRPLENPKKVFASNRYRAG